MSTTAWLVAGAIVGVVVYTLVTWGFYLRSRDEDKRIDFSKMRKWEDDNES